MTYINDSYNSNTVNFFKQYRYRYRQGFGQKSIGDIAADTFFKNYR